MLRLIRITEPTSFLRAFQLAIKLFQVCDYTVEVLRALGVNWGPTHTEVMATADGPRYLQHCITSSDASTRILNGRILPFFTSQADRGKCEISCATLLPAVSGMFRI